MTVGRDYMLNKKDGPSAPKLFLDTRIVPLVVNAASAVEVALERASVRSGYRPAVLLAGGAVVLSLGVFYVNRRRNAAASW